MAGTRASSLDRLAAATSREDQLREFGCYILQWQEDMLSLFADFRAELRGSLRSVAPNKDELMREESEFDQESSSIFGGNKGIEANSTGPRVLDAPIEADWIFGAALADENIARNLALPDLDANSLYQKVESNLLEANTMIDSGFVQEQEILDNLASPELKFQIPEQLEVIHKSIKPMVFDIESDKISEWVDTSTELVEIRGADLKVCPIDFLVKFPAHKVFVKMSRKQMAGIHDFVELPIVLRDSYGSMYCCSFFVFDPGKQIEFPLHIDGVETLVILIFYPGGLDCNGYGLRFVRIFYPTIWLEYASQDPISSSW